MPLKKKFYRRRVVLLDEELDKAIPDDNDFNFSDLTRRLLRVYFGLTEWHPDPKDFKRAVQSLRKVVGGQK